jgi:hypothetical protein
MCITELKSVKSSPLNLRNDIEDALTRLLRINPSGAKIAKTPCTVVCKKPDV